MYMAVEDCIVGPSVVCALPLGVAAEHSVHISLIRGCPIVMQFCMGS
jgi:hypothetical protein